MDVIFFPASSFVTYVTSHLRPSLSNIPMYGCHIRSWMLLGAVISIH